MPDTRVGNPKFCRVCLRELSWTIDGQKPLRICVKCGLDEYDRRKGRAIDVGDGLSPNEIKIMQQALCVLRAERRLNPADQATVSALLERLQRPENWKRVTR